MSDNPEQNTEKQETKNKADMRTWVEEIEVAGNQVVDQVKELIEEGNVRRLKIYNESGSVSIDVPLNVGVAVGGAMVILAPFLAALGAMAALVTKVKIEIVREEKADNGTTKSKVRVDVVSEDDESA